MEAVLEGELQATSAAIVVFDTIEDARRWYDSDEHREIRGLRQASGRTSVLLLDGFPASA